MSATRPSNVADKVHAQLTALRASAGALSQAPLALREYLAETRLHEKVAREYRARTARQRVASGGRAIIVTAGAPGAGKSRWLNAIAEGHRRIDPDEIKDLLLSSALAKGLLEDRLAHTLYDGGPVSPREVSGWVHAASNDIADIVRRKSLREGENIVVEGTLFWDPLVSQ